MDSPQKIGKLELIKSNKIIHLAPLFAKRLLFYNPIRDYSCQMRTKTFKTTRLNPPGRVIPSIKISFNERRRDA